MATEPTPEFDLGPLSWVQGEIDQALTRGLEALAEFRANARDATTLKHARSHVHQAAGAIQMVGLDAVVAFTDELERQFARLEELPPAEAAAGCDVVDRACRKLKIFLDELVNGAPPVPLKLYPEYEAMQTSRGVKAAAPTDLFYPDLSPRAPRIAPREALPPNRLPSYLVKQRRLYQRGLLAWLRGDEGGAATMRDAIVAIEDVTTQSGLRAFWWTVGALFEGLVENGLDAGFGVKQLAARIDLQIRRVSEGSAKVADRLRREVLYFAAICAPVGPQVQAVQRAFKLSGLIPSAEVLSADVVRLQPLLREAREQLAGAKDAWLKAASGRAENLAKLKQTLASVHAKAAEIHNGALMKLTAALVERLDKMPSSGVSEPVAMEYATALLLAESAFENYSNLSPDFPKQVDAMLARLDAARQGLPSAAGGVPMLDEMSKRAQERVLLAQVGREIQANLRHMEQVLDGFFRDNSKRAELAALAKDSAQIRGALRILGLDEADRLLGMCEEQIATYADPATAVSNDDLEMLAESLSGLGFYIEAVEQQRPERDRLIAPLIARRLGEAPAPAAPAPDSVEAAVAELRAALPQIVDELHQAPSDAAARDSLKRKLANLKDDAELIGDAELVAQVEAVLAEFEAGDAAGLAAAVDAIADTSAPAPEIFRGNAAPARDGRERTRPRTARDLPAGSLRGARRRRGAPSRAERKPRRSRSAEHRAPRLPHAEGQRPHGRPDAAGRLRLRSRAHHEPAARGERPVTGAVLALIETSQASFRGWVDALTRDGRVIADPRALHAALAAVERELPNGTPPPPAPPVQSAPPHAAPPVVSSADASSPMPSNVIELPRPAAPVRDAVSPPVLELIELPELGFGEAAEGPAVEVESELAETIEMVDVPAISPLRRPCSSSSRISRRPTPIWNRCPPSARGAASVRAGRARGTRRRDCAGRGGIGRRDDRRRDAVAFTLDHPVRRGRPACRHARERAFDPAVRPARGAACRHGAREPHAVRHPSHRRIPNRRDDGQGTRADADRGRAARRAAAGHRATGAGTRDRGPGAVRVAHQAAGAVHAWRRRRGGRDPARAGRTAAGGRVRSRRRRGRRRAGRAPRGRGRRCARRWPFPAAMPWHP